MRSRASRRMLACCVGASLALGAPGAGAAPQPERRARVAVRYIVSQQRPDGAVPALSELGSTADAVTSMVAAARAPRAIRRALRWLKLHHYEADSVGLKAKLVLALVAAGRNPARFAGHDWVQEIEATEVGGRYGEGTPVFEHALALLALAGAGATPSPDAVAWLVAAQCAGGGWQYDEPQRVGEDEHCLDADADPTDFYRSEADATGLAVQALAAAGAEPRVNPFPFFRELRDRAVKGGWGYSTEFPITNANSTALVLQAYAADQRDAPRRAVRALRRLQYRLCGKGAGAFAYSWVDADGDGTYRKTGRDVAATIAAVPGLLGRPYPIAEAEVSKRAPEPRRC